MQAPNPDDYRPRLWRMFPDAHSIRFVDDAELEAEYEGWTKLVEIEVGPDTNPRTRTFYLGMATDELFEFSGGFDRGTLAIPA